MSGVTDPQKNEKMRKKKKKEKDQHSTCRDTKRPHDKILRA